MQVFAKTDTGLVRQENQDRVIYKMLDENTVFVIVCDGMGGENAGSEASEIASKAIYNRIHQNYRSDANYNSLKNIMISAVNAANIIVHDISLSDDKKIGMGTTCVCGIIRKDIALILNVGDSRAYRYHNRGLEQITKDHTYVQFLYEQGELDEEGMKVHPERNKITKAVGIEETISPDYYEIDLNENDLLLFCSDGLSGYCTASHIIEALSSISDLETASNNLINYALQQGGRDNITVALVTDSMIQERDNG